jgi:uncharacterized protein YecE (DUF72 family)
VTSDLALVRFEGRNPGTWHEGEAPTAAGFAHRYSEEELSWWVPRIRELARSSSEVHLLMANCWRDDAVVNAAQLADMLVSAG